MTTIQNETVADIIKKLAKLPCPICQGKGDVAPVEQRECGACQGAGARFPWLRQECLGWSNDGKELVARWYPRCDISLEDAIAALTSEHSLLVLDEWRNILPLAVGATAEDVRLAFWQAVEKVAVR